MTQDYKHPIAPPEELVQQWIKEADGGHDPRWQNYEQDIATRAAQWGADQELEACLGWLVLNGYGELYHKLRASRRSKSQSLKEQALDELDRIPTHDSEGRSVGVDVSLLRRALESIPDPS